MASRSVTQLGHKMGKQLRFDQRQIFPFSTLVDLKDTKTHFSSTPNVNFTKHVTFTAPSISFSETPPLSSKTV